MKNADFPRQRHHMNDDIKYRSRKDINLSAIRGRVPSSIASFPRRRTAFFAPLPRRIRHKNEFTKSAPWHIKEYPSCLRRLLRIRPSARPLHLLLVACSGETWIPDGVSHKVASWRVIAGILKREKISVGKILRNKENSADEHLHAVQASGVKRDAARAASRKWYMFPWDRGCGNFLAMLKASCIKIISDPPRRREERSRSWFLINMPRKSPSFFLSAKKFREKFLHILLSI